MHPTCNFKQVIICTTQPSLPLTLLSRLLFFFFFNFYSDTLFIYFIIPTLIKYSTSSVWKLFTLLAKIHRCPGLS